MNSILLVIILVPVIEIYLFIKIGTQIGAIYTISLIFLTAIIGVYYAKYEGLLIIPGFATDLFGFLIIFPITRGLILSKFTKKFKKTQKEKNNFIEGEFEDIDDRDER